ncbi:MAG: MATE family efflux transporter [Oscillospiraceae bacterium]|nr:MATE family efflux transporter [Oscillospiraceae bacterium]
MSKTRIYDLTQGPITGTLLRFTLPFLGSSLLQFLYAVVDMIVVGRFSDSAGIAAVNNSSQIMQLVTSLVCGIATGGTVLLGQYIGARQEREAGKIVGSLIWLSVALSAVITAGLLLFRRGIVALMQVPALAVEPAVQYLSICGVGTVFIVGYNMVSSVLRGIGDSKRPMYFIAISCVLNILGDLALVGGLHLGAAGAAIATAGAQAVSFLCALIALKRGGLPFPVALALDWRKAVHILKVGVPVALQDLLTTLSFIIITVVVNRIGLEQSAAVGVVERLIGFSMLISVAFSQAIAVFAAQNIGAGQGSRARRGLWISVLVSLGLTAFFFAAMQLVPGLLVQIFTSDALVIHHGALYLRTYAFDALMVCLVFNLNGLFSGCGHTGFTFFNCIFSTFAVRIPLVIWFSTWPGVTMTHIGVAAPMASLVQVAIQLIYYRTGRWQAAVIGGGEEAAG